MKKWKNVLGAVFCGLLLAWGMPAITLASDVEVTTLDELCDAIEQADGTKENPTIITISGEIKVTKIISIPSDKYVKLVGKDANAVLKRGDNFTSTSGSITNHSHLLSVQGGLVLEGLTVDGNNQSGGSLVFIYGNNAFAEMNKGTILQNNGNGAVKLNSQYSTEGNPCLFTMNGGTIYNNTASQGAGVAITNYGHADFTMNDGEIKENTATSSGGGGGVYSCAIGTVTIKGGDIINNKNTGTSDGGAMNITGDSGLVIEGGEISGNQIINNEKPGRGGGIYKSGNASFTMTGGVVKDNSTNRTDGREGQDIYISSGNFMLGGNAQIPDGLFIERYENTSDNLNFYIISALQNEIGIEGLRTTPSAGRVVAEGKDYIITQIDFEKFSYAHASLALKFDKDKNRIVLGNPNYTVKYTLSNITYEGSTSVEQGQSLSTKLYPAEGYHLLPEDVTVKINGIILDSTKYQKFVIEQGKGVGISILANDITGNVEIEAKGGKHEGTAATCVAKAYCTICQQSYGEIDATNHGDFRKIAAKQSTHLVPGNIEYWYCYDCHKCFRDKGGTQGIKIDDTVLPILPEHTVDGTGWHFDEINHWNTCECKEILNKAAHMFKWVVDKEATATEKGLKHEECKVCGYKKTAVEIPAMGATTNVGHSDGETMGENSEVPETGDESNVVLWVTVMLATGAVLMSIALYRRKKLAD